MTDLGTAGGLSSHAYRINDLGQVVGYAPANGGEIPFVYENGKISDLRTLSGLDFQVATGINNRGQISGYGQINGVSHGFLLTPIPEPSQWLMLLMGSGLLLVCGNRRLRLA